MARPLVTMKSSHLYSVSIFFIVCCFSVPVLSETYEESCAVEQHAATACANHYGIDRKTAFLILFDNIFILNKENNLARKEARYLIDCFLEKFGVSIGNWTTALEKSLVLQRFKQEWATHLKEKCDGLSIGGIAKMFSSDADRQKQVTFYDNNYLNIFRCVAAFKIKKRYDAEGSELIPAEHAKRYMDVVIRECALMLSIREEIALSMFYEHAYPRTEVEMNFFHCFLRTTGLLNFDSTLDWKSFEITTFLEMERPDAKSLPCQEGANDYVKILRCIYESLKKQSGAKRTLAMSALRMVDFHGVSQELEKEKNQLGIVTLCALEEEIERDLAINLIYDDFYPENERQTCIFQCVIERSSSEEERKKYFLGSPESERCFLNKKLEDASCEDYMHIFKCKKMEEIKKATEQTEGSLKNERKIDLEKEYVFVQSCAVDCKVNEVVAFGLIFNEMKPIKENEKCIHKCYILRRNLIDSTHSFLWERNPSFMLPTTSGGTTVDKSKGSEIREQCAEELARVEQKISQDSAYNLYACIQRVLVNQDQQKDLWREREQVAINICTGMSGATKEFFYMMMYAHLPTNYQELNIIICFMARMEYIYTNGTVNWGAIRSSTFALKTVFEDGRMETVIEKEVIENHINVFKKGLTSIRTSCHPVVAFAILIASRRGVELGDKKFFADRFYPAKKRCWELTNVWNAYREEFQRSYCILLKLGFMYPNQYLNLHFTSYVLSIIDSKWPNLEETSEWEGMKKTFDGCDLKESIQFARENNYYGITFGEVVNLEFPHCIWKKLEDLLIEKKILSKEDPAE